VYLSGQIPIDPATQQLVTGDIADQIHRVFQNLRAVCRAAGSDLEGIVKLNVYMTDLGNFATVNRVMAEYFEQPYPARAAVGVAALPLGAEVEMEAVLGL
jgi:reactive intermediate/imine deaminase